MENLKIRGLMLHEKTRSDAYGVNYIEFYYNFDICPTKEYGKDNILRANQVGILTNIHCGKIRILSFRFRFQPELFNSIQGIRDKIRSICEEPATALLYMRDDISQIAEFAKIRISLFPTSKIYFYNTNESKLKKELKRLKQPRTVDCRPETYSPLLLF